MADSRKNPLWESVAIFAALFSLWPGILRFWAEHSDGISYEDLPLAGRINWASAWWDVPMYAAFAVMIIVAVRRVRRLRKAGTNDDDGSGFTVDGDGPVDPYASMHDRKRR